MKTLKFLTGLVMCAGLLWGMHHNHEPEAEPTSTSYRSTSYRYNIYDGSPSTSVIIDRSSLNAEEIKGPLRIHGATTTALILGDVKEMTSYTGTPYIERDVYVVKPSLVTLGSESKHNDPFLKLTVENSVLEIKLPYGNLNIGSTTDRQTWHDIALPGQLECEVWFANTQILPSDSLYTWVCLRQGIQLQALVDLMPRIFCLARDAIISRRDQIPSNPEADFESENQICDAFQEAFAHECPNFEVKGCFLSKRQI